jgi:hypothetical protein
MHVIGSDGTSQFELLGGERIFSRPNTRILVKGARRAYKSKKDSDYKRLGKQVFKYLKIQDNNDPSYVEMKKAREKYSAFRLTYLFYIINVASP